MDPMRYMDAGGVKPPSSLERKIANTLPSLWSKTLSEISPEADIIDILKHGRNNI